MAKRKRLSPAETTALEPSATLAPETKSIPSHPFGVAPKVSRRPPIAQVAGDAATQAALEEVADELRTAKTSGRMVLELPLSAVDETYLVRDRMQTDTAELEELIASLKARGQQTPIEVVELAQNQGQDRYGLISGWRRLTALRHLGEGHTHVRVTNQIFPEAICIPMSREMTITQWHVPINDHQCYWYSMFTSFGEPVIKTFTLDAMQRVEITATIIEVASTNQGGNPVVNQEGTPVPTPTPSPNQRNTVALLLALDPQDALVLKHLKDTGAIFDMVLRSPTSNLVFELDPVTPEYLIDLYGLEGEEQ